MSWTEWLKGISVRNPSRLSYSWSPTFMPTLCVIPCRMQVKQCTRHWPCRSAHSLWTWPTWFFTWCTTFPRTWYVSEASTATGCTLLSGFSTGSSRVLCSTGGTRRVLSLRPTASLTLPSSSPRAEQLHGASEGDDELLRSAMNIATTLQGGQQVLCITTFWYRNAIIQTLLTIQIRSFGKSTQVQIIAGKVGTHRYHICRASCKLFLGHFLFNVVHTYIAAKWIQ